MTTPHTYASPKPRSYLGVGLVVALHLAGIYALSAGMLHSPVKHQDPLWVKPVHEIVDPPPPVDKVKPEKPILKDIPTIPVPIPEDPLVARPAEQPPLVTGTPIRDTPGPLADAGPVTREAQPVTKARQDVTTPGAVCSVMPRPDVPAVNWTGDAVLQVVATVRGGHVVGTEFRVAQGALDVRTRRSLQRAVEAALAGYQCQGDAMFQQDFAFRID
ncbi:hypothetical protein [Pelomonas cellulosilytica]|uniref:TonB C-terminal domain-containing protein n=1 Tax=Pelomonas cellulosilytica TaxID=2906762 RepID=A0ABS8Y1A2_9BURK|nr:hypothetical protein [Pelomonas sp. P8]MCE4557780.1 hypothetical protein [Pelomonas sp. P8]